MKRLHTKQVHCVKEWLQDLINAQGPQGWWPKIIQRQGHFFVKHGVGTPRVFEVALGAILTQNTAWKNVELALIGLATKKWLTPERIVRAPLASLEQVIRSAGYFHQKAKKLKLFSAFALRQDLSSVTRASLLEQWGIGKETADTILLYGLHQSVFVVDAYTRRWLASLFRSSRWLEAEYDEIRLLCEEALDHDVKQMQEAHAAIVAWGKVARRPKKRQNPTHARSS